MATNECFIDAAPERVFSVLADPHSYEHWVVGAQAVVKVIESVYQESQRVSRGVVRILLGDTAGMGRWLR